MGLHVPASCCSRARETAKRVMIQNTDEIQLAFTAPSKKKLWIDDG